MFRPDLRAQAEQQLSGAMKVQTQRMPVVALCERVAKAVALIAQDLSYQCIAEPLNNESRSAALVGNSDLRAQMGYFGDAPVQPGRG